MAAAGPGGGAQAPAPSVERVIQEGYVKAAAIILEARLATLSGGESRGRSWVRPSSSLALG